MRIDFEKKIVFIANMKTGSRSVRYSLSKIGFKSPNTDFVFPYDPSHCNMMNVIEYLKSISEDPKQYYFFTFTRNPYSRLVSSFFYQKPDENLRPYWHAEYLGPDEHLSFKKWASQKKPLFPMYDEIMVTNMDYQYDIFKLENLSEAIETIEKKTGLKLTVPHLNSTRHNDYKTYYDQELILHTYTIYKKELDKFAYIYQCEFM